MIFICLASLLLVSIHHGQCAMQATANLQFDLTSTSIGTLNFVQNDANSPVKITGTLTSLNASSSHVCLIIKKENIFFFNMIYLFKGFSCS